MEDMFRLIYRRLTCRDVLDAGTLTGLVERVNQINRTLHIDCAVSSGPDDSVRDVILRLSTQLSVAALCIESASRLDERREPAYLKAWEDHFSDDPGFVVPAPLAPKAKRKRDENPDAAEAERRRGMKGEAAGGADILHAECETLRRENSGLMNRISDLEKRLNDTAARLEQQNKSIKERAKRALEIIQSIIYYRDRLFIQLEYAQNEKSELGQKLVDGMLHSTRKMLTDNGVTVLDEGGSFDVKVHQIVSVKQTNDPALDLQIISTQREGYRYDDGLIRYQEVTVYQYKGEKEP